LKESYNHFLDHALSAIFVDKYYNILLSLIRPTYRRVANSKLGQATNRLCDLILNTEVENAIMLSALSSTMWFFAVAVVVAISGNLLLPFSVY